MSNNTKLLKDEIMRAIYEIASSVAYGLDFDKTLKGKIIQKYDDLYYFVDINGKKYKVLKRSSDNTIYSENDIVYCRTIGKKFNNIILDGKV